MEARPSMVEQLRSFGPVFWVSLVIEMCERLAYYGLRTVLPIYMLLALESGGPQFDNIQKGSIYAIWAAISSFVPIFSGGYADRFGFRITIALSVILDVAGFLTMAFATDLAAAWTGGVSGTVPGHPAVYNFFLLGAMGLALGTAVFKPGIQGLVATQVTPQNGSFAWSIFYQVVNVGGFLGPILAGYLRVLTWKYVFFACAAIATLNLVWLLLVKEPVRTLPKASWSEFFLVALRGMGGILDPRLFAFLTVFSGFWAMFYQLYDLLPNFIEDWVDSRSVYQAVFVPGFALVGGAPPVGWEGRVPQEMMINLNAGMIMLLVSAIGYVSGRLRSMQNMILGIIVSAVGIVLLDSRSGWVVLGAIAVFSVGEMFASPTKMRYVADLATPDKKALYLGYVNATVGIGWTIGSWIAGDIYERTGDKVGLARRYLVEVGGLGADAVRALPKTEVLPTLAQTLGKDAGAVTDLLWSWQPESPATVWWTFAGIGLVSMLGMIAFDAVTRRQLAQEEWVLIALVGLVSALCYGPRYALAFPALMVLRRLYAGVLDASGDGAWRPGAASIVTVGVVGWAAKLAGLIG